MMDDSAASTMTIDFLRARLLSERSVSRTARQRADQLAKRVEELEEQLQFISLQRQKAEKATSHVLAILENHGVNDLSEIDFDSDTDQGIKEDQMSVTSKSVQNNGEELSGSDDFSPLPGTSLSWKTTKHTQHSVENKYMNSSKRCSSYSSVASSSPKHRSGKSCRQIRRRETRMEELRIDNIVHGPHSSAVIPSLEGTRNCSESGTEFLEEGSEIMEEKVTNSRHCLNGHGGGNKDMERALEQQAQLIGRYEDEEKAQRDWEERFRENNSSPPDSCEPGNQSDITEERDEIKTRASDEIAPKDQNAKSGIEVSELSEELQTVFQPPAHTYESQVPECLVNEKQAEDQLQNCPHYSPSNNYQRSPPCDSLKNQTPPPFISSNIQNESYAIVPHKLVGDFGGVLEALKQAKSSLQHRLGKLPSLEGGSVGRPIITVPNPSTTKSKTKMEIPVGCANLFRVPSDSQFEAASTKPNPYMGNRSKDDHFMPFSYLEKRSTDFSNDRQSVPNPYLESKAGVLNNDQLTPNPYMETRLNINSRLMPSPYMEARTNMKNDRFMSASPAAAGSSSYMKSQMASNEGYSRSSLLLPSGGGVSSSEPFSFYDDHNRRPRNMYR